MGQNIGAQKPKRVFGSFWRCMAFGTLIGGGVGFLVTLTGRWGMGLILGFSATTAIEYGQGYLFYIEQFKFINAITSVLVHALQAYGYPVFGSINAIVFTLGFRILWMQWIYPMNPTWETLMLCFTVSWILVAVFNSIMTIIVSVRYRHGKYKKI
jgi:Na+-driven multidrug efflux pump